MRMAILMGVLAMAGSARADAVFTIHPGQLIENTMTPGSAPGMPAQRGSEPRGFAKLGAALAHKNAHLFSQSNDNQNVVLWVQLDGLADGAWPFLRFGNIAFQAESSGSDSSFGKSATFPLPRATAEKLAAAAKIPIQDRRRLDAGLSAKFSAAPAQLGQPMPIKLLVKHSGKGKVGFVLGGRNRGPRDNRFAFTVTRNGKPLPVIEAHDFGGLSTIKMLAKGETVELSADLASWVKITQPGKYEVTCSYGATLHPSADHSGQWPDHAQDVWDWTAKGKLTLVVE